MKSISKVLLVSVLSAVPGAAASPPAPAQEPPGHQVELRAELDLALARAAKENRRVLVQWASADPLPRCRALDAALAAPDVKRKLLYEYDVVRVATEGGTELARDLGVDLAQRTPPLLSVLDSKSKVLATTDVEGWWNGATSTVDSKGLLAFLTAHQAPYLEAAEVREAALARAKAEGKRVFLHFGAPW